MKLRACIITKNESRCIARCINSFKRYVDEIIVSDTGSSDDTVSIARKLGAHVFTQKWENDFALARNRALDAAGGGGWILFPDADEYFKDDGARKLRRRLEALDADPSYDAVWTRLTNIKPDGTSGESMPVIRAFRASDEIRFEGAVHEALRKNGKPLRAASIPAGEVLILHDGYTGSRGREKAERNIELLNRDGSEEDVMRYYYLGRAYTATGSYDEALGSYLEYLRRDCEASPVTLSAILSTLALTERMDCGDESRRLTDMVLERFPSHPAAYLLKGDRLFGENRLDDASNAYEHSFKLNVPELDFSSNLPENRRRRALLRTASIAYLNGAPDNALGYLKEAGISRDTAGLELAVRCLASYDTAKAAEWLDSVIPKDDIGSLELLLDAIYGFTGGLLYLVYFERWFNLTGIRDERFPIMQIIAGEYSAAISELDRQCLDVYPWDGTNNRALMCGRSFKHYDTLRRRMLAAALLSGNAREILFARKRFGADMAAAIDLALGLDVEELRADALECCIGVFEELLRLGASDSGAAAVWLEVILLFGDEARLKAAELMKSAGVQPPF